jgi:hypothetical protein
MVKSSFLPYTPENVERLKQMKQGLDMIHAAKDNGDFVGFQNAIANLTRIYATTEESQEKADMWLERIPVILTGYYPEQRTFLDAEVARLEHFVGSYDSRLSMSFQRKMTGLDKFDDEIFDGHD